MIAIDTNLLLRYILRDDKAQFITAQALMSDQGWWISHTVLLEAEWVLRSAYRFDRAQIEAAFRRFLGLPRVSPDSPAVVAQALNAYGAGLDFADALHLASTPDAHAFFTFDRRLARAAGKAVSMVPD